MKKILFMAFFILIFNSGFMMALDIVKLTPLKENEVLHLNYDKSVLSIEKISDTATEIYYTCKSYWGASQISSDKRKILIYENGMHDLYLLDGNDGSITYKGNFSNSGFPSADFKYIITYSYVPEDRMLNLFVYDMATMKELYNFPWISQREHFLKEGIFLFRFYRSLDPDYDFIIYSIGEAGEAFAYSLLNAETKVFTEHLFKKPEMIPDYSNYECGWE